MFVRIVKMTFLPDHVDEFQARFHSIKDEIIDFEGCDFLELYQDKEEKNVFFTYSFWNSEKELDAYRGSDFFKKVWGDTKKLFSQKPEAWSVDKIVSLPKPKN